jgi:hypothetical protein
LRPPMPEGPAPPGTASTRIRTLTRNPIDGMSITPD